MDTFVKVLPLVFSAALAVLSAFQGDVQAFVATHPSVAALLGFLYSALLHVLPSPLPPKE